METKYFVIGGVVLGVAGVIYYLNKSGAAAAQGVAPGMTGPSVMAPTMTTPMNANFSVPPQVFPDMSMPPFQPVFAVQQNFQPPQRPLPGMPGFQSPGLPPPGLPPGLPHSFPSTNLNQRTSAPTTPSMTPGTQPRAPSPNLASKGGRFALRNVPASEPMIIPPGPGNSPSIPAVVNWPGPKTYNL